MTHLLRGLLAVLLLGLAASPAYAAGVEVNAGISTLLLALGLAALGATVEGGVFGVYRNKIGGVVFSTWRGLQTARQKVTPSNPQSVAQTDVREVFAYVVLILRKFGSSFYRTDWNNASGNLPGFQSLMKFILAGADYEAQELAQPTPVELGPLDNLADLSVSNATPGELEVEWVGTGLKQDDEVVVFGYPRLPETVDSFIPTPEIVTVADEFAALTDLKDATEYVIGAYIRGEGANEGEYSTVEFKTMTTSA